MDYAYVVFPLIAGIGLCALIWGMIRMPGSNLQNKFVRMGRLKDRTYSEICSFVGLPNAISSRAEGKACQWIKPGYHIVLIFDKDDICQGVTRQTSV